MAFSLGTLSQPATDFFSQFQPYEQGGITGQPSVDPKQLQSQPAPSGFMSQGGPMNDPRWTNGTWGDATTMPMQPTLPNPSAVVPPVATPMADWNSGANSGMPSAPPNPYNKPGGDGSTFNPIGGPGDANNTMYLWNHPELWTMPWQGPRPDNVGGGMRGNWGSGGLGTGGVLGRLGSLLSQVPSQGQHGLMNAMMHHVRTPDGRMVQVPDDKLAEVLQRGGMKVGGA